MVMAVKEKTGARQNVDADVARRAFRTMLLARATEDKLAALYRAGMIKGGVFLGKGQEALSTASAIFLKKGDIFGPLIRDQAGRLAFGDTVLDTLRTYLGSAQGPMRGRDGNIHRGRPREGYYAMISHLGALIPVVAGGLYARRLRGETGVVGVTSIGDGGTSTGAFHEGINLAAVEGLPLVVVVANNQYAYSTPNNRQFVCADLLDKAAGYGIAGFKCDGTDPAACLETLSLAVHAAREGNGPQLVVATLLRLVGHGEHDDAGYVDPDLRKANVGRDCIKVGTAQLVEAGLASPADIAAWTTEAQAEVEAALNKAQREKGPDPNNESWQAISTERLVEGQHEEDEE
ncbi:MAG: thiamine pyrophosphate-dependent dehydrogenase E1 component subunit alpha [Chthoniobacterales bacterium]|nr:thiamine pyrophosphate-dependent dehydrogenase E1 component subunit alpha [Chthoniobacterales bacterium]